MSRGIMINPLGSGRTKTLGQIAAKRGTAGLSADSLKEEGLGSIKHEVVQGLTQLVGAIRLSLQSVTGEAAKGLSKFIDSSTHSETISQHLESVKTLKQDIKLEDHPEIAKKIVQFETTLTKASERMEILKDVHSHISGFDKLSGDDKVKLADLFHQGVFSVGDPPSKEFLMKFGSMMDATKGDAKWISTTISDLAKGNLETAQLIQGFSVNNLVPTGHSGQLDGVVKRIGLHGEAMGTQKPGTTQLSQSLRYLSHELASTLQMNDGGTLNQLSSIKFDAKTVSKLLSGNADKFKMDKEAVNIAFGQAMVLQHMLDGEVGNIDAQLKEAGIPKTSAEIKSLSGKGFSGTAQITRMCKVVDTFAKSISKSSTLKQTLTTQLTHGSDIIADQYQNRLFIKLTGGSGVNNPQHAEKMQTLGKSIDFGSGALKRTKIGGVTVISGNMKTKMKGLISEQKSLSSILTAIKPHEKSLESIQAQLKMATPEQKEKVIANAGKPLQSVAVAKKDASRSIQTLTALIRMSIIDTLSTKGWPDNAADQVQSGDLHHDVMAALSNYGLSPTQIKESEVLVRYESIKFKGADSIKSWNEGISLEKSQEKELNAAEKTATTQFIQGHTTTETSTVKQVKSWVNGIKEHGKILIDMTKGTTIKGGKLSELTQEAFLMGTALDIQMTSKTSKTMMIEAMPHPTDPAQSSFMVTLSKSSAKALGISLDLLGGLISIGHTRESKTTTGVQLQFHSKEALTLFFSGIIHNSVNVAASLADISQVMMVDGKKVSISNQIDIGFNPTEYMPIEVPGMVGDLASLSISIEANRSSDTSITRNLEKTITEKSTETKYGISGLKLDSIIPTIGVKTTSKMEYDKHVLQAAIHVKEYHVEFGSSTDYSKKVTQKGMEMVLSPAAKKALKATPEKMEQFKSLMRTLEKDDTVRVEYGLSQRHCLEVASMMDPSSPLHSPEKAKAILADHSVYEPKSIQVISQSSTEKSKTNEVSNVSITRQKGVSEWQLKAKITL